MKRACLAITLVNPKEPQLASSYLWCTRSQHGNNGLHVSYCGIWWTTSDLVEPTPNMIIWRTGNVEQIGEVAGRML